MKKRVSPFIAVLPVLISCAKPTTNPPPLEPTSTQAPTSAGATITTPDPKPLTPKTPTQYTTRQKYQDGKCYVQIYANPPYNVEVSCTAPIEPPAAGSTWCTVPSASDPARKVNVLCETK